MGAGSVVGAVIGGALVGIVPIPVQKFGLGIILNVSAWADVQAQALSGRRAPVHLTFEGSRRAPLTRGPVGTCGPLYGPGVTIEMHVRGRVRWMTDAGARRRRAATVADDSS